MAKGFLISGGEMSTCWGLYVARTSKVRHYVVKSQSIFSDILSFIFCIFSEIVSFHLAHFNNNLIAITYTFECRS